MRLLLDTHILLWWLSQSKKLSVQSKKLTENSRNTIFVSAISIWEISLKQSQRKLRIPSSYIKTIKNEGLLALPITFDHALKVKNLPFHHKDPFDRLLIAQAMEEKLILISDDKYIKKYKIKMIS